MSGRLCGYQQKFQHGKWYPSQMTSFSLMGQITIICMLNQTQLNMLIHPGLQRFTQKKKATDLPAGHAPRNSLGWATSRTTPPPHTAGCTQWAEDIWCLQKSFSNNSRLQKLKTRHDFQAFLCHDVRLVNFMFLLHHPFGVKEEYNL